MAKGRLSTGIEGLDQILHGGLIAERVYVAHGESGTGKTTLGFHFLAAGEKPGSNLLITFDQPEDHLRSDAKSLGFSLENVLILDLTPTPEAFSALQSYDIFSPSEVERDPITMEIAKAIRENNVRRIFVDGFDHFRQLAADAFNYRRLIQSFFRFATHGGATVLVASEARDCIGDADAVIHLDLQDSSRNVRILKYRGSDFQPGEHSMRLTGHGIQIFPSAA
jgi:circadian clock protein KaiC